MPGVAGPGLVRDESFTLTPGGQRVALSVRFDPGLHRYVCDQLTISRDVTARPAQPVTTEALRRVKVTDFVLLALLRDGRIRDLPNPGGREPWGRTPPDGLADEGPTDRVLRWVAHLYRLALAVEAKPTKAVQESFGLSRATTGRWIAAARDRGYLGATEPGKAGV